MQFIDFNKNCDISNWQTTDDVVMGGKSNGQFILNKEGNGVFKGEVSLENNGGFSSVKYKFEPKTIKGYTKVILNIKGDGKLYNFRIKSDVTQRHSYNYKFKTTGEWQTIEVLLSEFYPIFKGRKLDIPNFFDNTISQIVFLIANRQNEIFQLEIKDICLK